MTRPLPLGFVIPAFNAASTIGDTLMSLQSQSVRDWRAVVVDDGSTDETAAVVRRVSDPRIALIERPNQGVAAARNTGFAALDTTFVSFIDSDDTIAPGYCRAMLAAVGDADAVCCAHRYVREDLSPLDWVSLPMPHSLTIQGLCEFNALAIGSAMVRRSLLCVAARDTQGIRAAGPFDSRDGSVEDWGMWLRVAACFPRCVRPVMEPLYHYRLRPRSRSSCAARMWQDGTRLIQRAQPYADVSPVLRRWGVRSLARAVSLHMVDECAEIAAELGTFTPNDVSVLGPALRWAYCFRDQIAPANSAGHLQRWAAEHRSFFEPDHFSCAFYFSHGVSRSDWLLVAHRAQSMKRPGERIVIYGMGRNSLGCREAFNTLGVEYAMTDDDADRLTTEISILPTAIDDRCVVVVTPDDRREIVRRLMERGITRVIEPSLAAWHVADGPRVRVG